MLGNYDITYNTANFTISKAHLKVTAEDKSKTYDGSAFTAFTAKLEGFVNGETISVVTGIPGSSGNAVGAVSAGTYTITPTVGTLSAANYDFTPFVNGTLTINKADANVSVSGYTGTYDGLLHGATGSFTGVDANGAAVGGSLNLGATYKDAPGGTAHWTFTGGTNYKDRSGDVSITISKARLTVTADNKSRLFGGANPPFTATITGFVHSETVAVVSGSPAFGGTGPAAITTTPVGDYVITPAVGTLVATNYDFTFVDGTLTIGKAHLTVTAVNASKQYSDPLPSFTVTYSGFVSPVVPA